MFAYNFNILTLNKNIKQNLQIDTWNLLNSVNSIYVDHVLLPIEIIHQTCIFNFKIIHLFKEIFICNEASTICLIGIIMIERAVMGWGNFKICLI